MGDTQLLGYALAGVPRIPIVGQNRAIASSLFRQEPPDELVEVFMHVFFANEVRTTEWDSPDPQVVRDSIDLGLTFETPRDEVDPITQLGELLGEL
jgi:hypothetical protein